jgi:hypothetical protein
MKTYIVTEGRHRLTHLITPRASVLKSMLRQLMFAGTITALLGGLLVALAAPANAQAAPGFKEGCTDFSYEKVWQTSRKWGRARERTCVDYTESAVRGYVQFQVDWPLDCTVWSRNGTSYSSDRRIV